ncbi:restriction endonuclease subunit S [Shewanella oncorhynchi]|uniref:restriction endonuclease subunit S n=4 Tax=Shewanella TaxID=22 RepID=UPI003D7BA1F3
MSVKNKVPEIRFKGFSGEWEEKVLEDICDVRDGTHASPKYQQNGFPLVTSKNVKNGYINYDDVQYISKIDFDEINKRSKVDVNDILIGMIGTIGNIALIRQTPDFAIKNVALIKDKNEMDFLYSYYFLQSPITTQQLDDFASGGTQKFISLSNVRSLLICVPEREEQTAIGNTFQKLDSLINQHQQKHDKLSNIKKAMLEKMFPKQGETIPEIRFKGFSGEWEEKVLEDICDVRDGTHASPKYQQNGFPLVTSKNVKNGYINYDDVQYISKIDFDEINKRSKVDVNDILIGMIGTIGNIALIRQTPDFAIKNVALIKDKNEMDFLYSYYFLQSPITTQQLDDFASGGTQKFISLSNVRSLLICVPEREEQTAIGNYFQKLDALINQHQQQITKLTNIKQACLNKMFV